VRAGVALVPVAAIVTLGAGDRADAANLRQLTPDQRVTSITHCRGAYRVALGNGTVLTFEEYNLAIKTDTGADGPAPGAPAIVPQRGGIDRVFVVFASVEELGRSVRKAPGCAE
jgi:cytochrome c